MNSKAQSELAFWRQYFVDSGGAEHYMAARDSGAMGHHLEFFGKYLSSQKGPGLDVGPGLVSIFEFLPGIESMYSIEPLQVEMDKIFSPPTGRVVRVAGSGENMPFADGQFQFVYCANVIDHTPNPDRMLSEIERVLAPGGRFYFNVNFDKELWVPGHYSLWTPDIVAEKLQRFTLVDSYEYARPEYNQRLYWGVYTK